MDWKLLREFWWGIPWMGIGMEIGSALTNSGVPTDSVWNAGFAIWLVGLVIWWLLAFLCR
jgi:hypothetical protein